MNNVKNYYNWIEIRTKADESIDNLRLDGCLCQNDLELGSATCKIEFDSRKCSSCGFEFSTRKCVHNEFLYSCPECGASLT